MVSTQKFPLKRFSPKRFPISIIKHMTKRFQALYVNCLRFKNLSSIARQPKNVLRTIRHLLLWPHLDTSVFFFGKDTSAPHQDTSTPGEKGQNTIFEKGPKVGADMVGADMVGAIVSNHRTKFTLTKLSILFTSKYNLNVVIVV